MSGAVAAGCPEEAPPASARPVGTGWMLALSLVNVGAFAAFNGPSQSLLPQQAEYFSEHKEAVLAVVSGVGAFVSLLANPIAGALSDRTASRWGRRVPWIAGGAAVAASGLLVLASADGVTTMVVGWSLVQLGANGLLAAAVAAIPDRVATRERGRAGGWFGIGQTSGILAGVAVGTFAGDFRAGFMACAVVLLLCVVPFVVVNRDLPTTRAEPLGVGAFLRGFWISPREHPDFAWVWIGRFLVMLGQHMATIYLYFYLEDRVGLDKPAQGLLVLVLTYALTTIAVALVAGRISDRTGRRKVFVLVSTAVIAAGAAALGLWPDWYVAIGAAVALGFGLGVFLAVDLAIATVVLPDAESRGRDLGLINVANTLPQVLAPAVAALVVTTLGGYTVLFCCAAASAVVGGLFIRRVRAVR